MKLNLLIFLLTTSIVSFSNAEQVIQKELRLNKNEEVTVQSLTAAEGTDSFSLSLHLGIKKDDKIIYTGDEYSNNSRAFDFDPVTIYDYIKVKPEVKFTANATPTGIILSGNFKPETKYEVTLLKGFQVVAGQRLYEDAVNSVKTGSFKPHIRFSSKSRYMPGALGGTLTFESVNVKNIQVSIRQVLPQNLHQWLTSYESASQYVSEELKSQTIKVKSKKNTVYKGSISLDEFNPLGNGVYVVTATEKSATEPAKNTEAVSEEESSEDESGYYYAKASDATSVVVTNISAVVKWSAKNELKAWVIKSADLTPVSGATVELYSESNRKLDACVTQTAQGECGLSWKNMKSPPYAVVVKSGGDATYIKLADLSIKNDRFHVGTRDFVSDQQGFDAFLYSARDLFRPGEKVDLAVQVRNKKYEAVSKLPLNWKIINPKGKIVRESTTTSDDFGMSGLPFQTQLSFETGKYLAQVWTGKQMLHEISFLIEEFVPERIGLNVNAEKDQYINKDAAKFNLEALYLFGPPVVAGEFKASCTLTPAFKTVPKHPEYATGFYMAEMNKAINLDVVTGTTDEKGRAKYECDYKSQLGQKFPVVYELKAKTDVEEAGSSRVTSKTAATLISSTDTIVGLKVLDKSGSEIKIEGAFFDLKGDSKKSSSKLKARLYRIQQNWTYSYDGNGSRWRVEELVVPSGIEKVVQANDTKFEVSLTPPESWGQWLVRVEDINSGYTADVNTGYIGWYFEAAGGPGVREPEDLKMEVSKNRVSPGESFKVLVQAPFAGRLLVSLETNVVHQSKWVNVSKPGNLEVEFETPNVLPNFYVTGLLIKTPREGKRFLPARAFGSRNIEVVPNEHRLSVSIAAPELMESRKDLKIEISNDKKVPVKYSIAVVDEGILQMTKFKSPSPLARFFEARKLGVISSETIGWTMAGVAKGKETSGGDEGKSGAKQNIPVKLIAFFEEGIKSDSTGRAEVSFKIPEFQGKLRIMVVASHKTRFGSGDLNTTVRDPIVIQSTLPRFLTNEDRFQFPVALTNTSGKDQNVQVKINSGNEVKISSSGQSQALSNNQMKVLKFPVEVTGTNGTAEISVLAKSDDGKLSSTESFALPVKPRGVEQTLHLAYKADEKVALDKVIPTEWRRDYVKVTATVSNLPFLNQLSNVDYLLHYPYGCIEQTTSSTLPLLAMEDILKFVNSRTKNPPPLKDMVNRGIARVLSMQTGSGGFAYWPGDYQASSWGTPYALYMLLEAKKLGYEVPNDAVESALDYLQNEVRSQTYNINDNSRNSSNPWMLYVLAKGGRQVTAELRKAAETNRSINFKSVNAQHAENLFLLAATAKALGDNETLNKLNAEELFTKQLTGARSDSGSFWSDDRSDALRLVILQELWPDNPAIAVLSQRVAVNLSKRSYNTQEVAWGALALGKMLRNIQKWSDSDAKKISLQMNGNSLAAAESSNGLPMWQIDGALTKNTFTVKNLPQGAGAWLYLNVLGFTDKAPKGSSTLTVSRTYKSRSGDTVSLSNVKQGDVLTVQLQFESKAERENVAIVDRLPAGFEIENARLGRGEEISWISKDSLFTPDYVDMRDDRIQLFGTVGKEKEFYYSVRAVTPGSYVAPAPMIEQMYDPESVNYGESEKVEIKEK
jgi:uncharacterized protein YfaS (alpha-2-macroglobulin family)